MASGTAQDDIATKDPDPNGGGGLAARDLHNNAALDAASSAAVLELSQQLLGVLKTLCSDGLGDNTDVKPTELATLLLQSCRLVELKLMRKADGDANLDGHFREVLDGALAALEWAADKSRISAGAEVVRLLSCLSLEAERETETSVCDHIKSNSQLSVLDKLLIEQRAASSSDPEPPTRTEPSKPRNLSPMLARLIKPVPASTSSRSSSSHPKSEPNSTSLDRRRQEARQQLLSPQLDGARRLTRALCSALKACGLLQPVLDLVTDGLKLALRLSFDLSLMRWNLLELARFIAWTAAHPAAGQEELTQGVRSGCERVLTIIIDIEGGSAQMHFRRNLEVLILSHMFVDSAPPLPLVSVSSELFALALSLLTKMMNRVIADGYMQASAVTAEDLSVVIAACDKSPADSPLSEGCGWDCTAPYSAIARLAAFLSVAGQQFLTTLLIALTESCVFAPAPSVSPPASRLSPPPPISSRSPPAPFASTPKPGSAKSLASVSRSSKLGSEKLKAIEALESIPHAPTRGREGGGGGRSRDGLEPHVRAVDRLLKDSLFKLPATDLFGPLLAAQITDKVLDSLLDLLHASSELPLPLRVDAASSHKLHARLLVHAIVDKDYLSPDRAKYVVQTAVARWPQKLPRDVLALVARIAIKDASAAAAADEELESGMPMMLWEAALEGFVSSARDRARRVGAEGSPVVERSAEQSSPGPGASPESEEAGGSVGRGRGGREGRSVMSLNHARVLGLLFNTMRPSSRAACLRRAVETLAAVVEEGAAGLENVAGIVALIQYILSHYTQPSAELLAGLEASMRTDTAADVTAELEKGGLWTTHSIVRMLRMEAGSRSMDLSASSARLFSSDPEPWLVLDLTSPAQGLEAAAWEELAAESGGLARKLEQELLKLLQSLLAGDAVGEQGAREGAGCVLHAAWVTYGRLHVRRSAGAALSECTDEAKPALQRLAGLRAWFLGQRGQEATAQDLKVLTQATDQICKSCNGSAHPSTSTACILLGAHVALKQTLLSGLNLDPPADAESSTQAMLLEDAEGLLGSAQSIVGLLASVWSACAAADAPGMDRLSEAALAAGLPLETQAAVLPEVFRRNDARILLDASSAFAAAAPGGSESLSDESRTRAWDVGVQTSLLEGFAVGEQGSDSVLRSALNLARRLVDLVTWFALKLKRMREGGPEKQDLSALDNTTERLSVLLADLATDSRFAFLRPQCEACLKELAPSEDSHVLLLDLSHLRRIDTFLKAISSHDSMQPVASEPIQHCVRTVLDLVHESRRSAALVVFYLDHSPGPVNRSVQTLPIDEALPEGLHGKGDLALFLHVIAVSRDAQASRDVLKLFRAILERPASPSLGRLKLFVRRRVAQVLAALGSGELKGLLERLLLFKGLGSEVSHDKEAKEAPAGMIRASSITSVSSNKIDVQGGGGEGGGQLAEATLLRRSTLRLLTLVLDGVDESVDALAGVLIDALLDLVPLLIRMPRVVLKECFAIIKFVCFRQSQARIEQMIDVLVKALSSDVEHTSPEAAANLVDILSGLVASFQSVSRAQFSDLCSVTSAHVRASDTLSTVSTSSEVSYTSRGESTVATSAVTYISSTGHMDPDDVSAVGSHMDCASMDMDGETASMDDDEELLRESQGLLDEQEAAAEEEERRLAGKVCTYTKTSDTFSEQHWYHCWTCGLAFQEGCCAVCAKVCHKGHDVTYSRFSRFFCDCGAGKRQGQGCEALAPRPADPTNGLGSAAQHRDMAAASNPGAAVAPDASATGTRSPVLGEEDMDMTAWLADCERLPAQLTRQARETLLQRLRSKEVSTALSNLHDNMISVLAARDSAVGPKVVSLRGLATVVAKDSKIVQLRRYVKGGSFAVSTGKPATGRNAASGAAETEGSKPNKRFGLMSMAPNGLLILAEGDHLLTLEARKKLMDASYLSAALDKSSVKTLFKTYLGFEATRVVSNPAYASHVAVCGAKHCSVYTVSPAGKVLNVVAIELSLEAFGQDVCISDMFWMPNSEACLCVVTDVFVNVYDLSIDNISPSFSLRLPGATRITAATLCWDATTVAIMVMGEDGRLFLKRIGEGEEKEDGPMEMDMAVQVPKDMAAGGDVRGHALSFSLKSQVLVGCFQAGSIVIAKLSDRFASIEECSRIDLGHTRMVLDQVMDVGNAWGQMLISGDTAGSCGLLHITQGKAKIVWLNAGASAPSGRALGMAATVSTRPALPAMLLFMDDGGLYHWVLTDQNMRVAEVVAATAAPEDDAKPAVRPVFPVDVFEKGVCITQKVKISGDFAPRPPLDLVRKFSSATQPIISPHLDHLKVVIQNQNPEMCIIGLLVLVGEALNAHIPTELHVMDRSTETHAGVKRWYQLPLTTEEILNSDRELVLSTLGSHVAANPPAIDQIEVFGMRKDKFGWAEKQRRAAQVAAAKDKSRKVKRASSMRVIDPVEKAATSIMNALAVHWSVGGLQSLESQCRTCRDKLLEELPKHLLSQRPLTLRPTLKRLLKVLFPTREVYCEAKDRSQLMAIADLLNLCDGQQLATIQLLSPGMLATASSMVARVSSRRPAHLAALLDERPAFLRQLAQSFWLVYASSRYQSVDELERTAESLVDTLHAFGTVQALKALDGGPESGDASALARVCMELLVEGLQNSSGRMRRVFEQRIGSLTVGDKEPVVTEVHFNDASQQQHDHMDSMRLGPLFWEECPVPEQGLERDGQSSIVYCCDHCGQQPVVGRRFHCRVCKDFDLCGDCYRSIQEAAANLDPETDPTDEWLYPAGVDPSDEEALVKLAVELSLEKDTPRPPSAEFALALLPVLCEKLPAMLRQGGRTGVPSLQLLLRFAKTALRDDGAALGTLADALFKMLLDIGSVQPGSGGAAGKRVQPICLCLLVLAQLVAGPERGGAGSGAGGASAGSAGRGDRSWKRFEGRGVSGMHPEVLRVLKESAFLGYLHQVLDASLQALEQHSKSGAGAGSGQAGRLMGKGTSLSGEDMEGMFEEGGGELLGQEQAMHTPEGQTQVLLDAVLQLCLRLQACQASLHRPSAPSTPLSPNTDPDADPDAASGSSSSPSIFSSEWAALLCRCLHQTRARDSHRLARRVLRGMFATRQEYHAVRDKAAIERHVDVLTKLASRGVLETSGEATHQDTVLVTWTLGKLLEMASVRPGHWQHFCRQVPSVLPLLVQAAMVMPEETVEAAVRLLSCSFVAVQSRSASGPEVSAQSPQRARKAKPAVAGPQARKQRAGKGETGPESDSTDESEEEGKASGVAKGMAMGDEPVNVVMEHAMVEGFLRKLALEFRAQGVRKEACRLVEGMWRHSSPAKRLELLKRMMPLVPELPSFGQNSRQLLQTLGSIVQEVDGEEQEAVLLELAETVTRLIKEESLVVAHHPNACIYRALHRIVELEGYYLESKPCLICNNAEIPFGMHKLDSLKAEAKFTDSTQLVKLICAQTIQRFTVTMTDVRLKPVKTINLYYNNKPVADVTELRGKWHLWKKTATLELTPEQLEASVDLTIPIVATNILIEFLAFHELPSAAAQRMVCPRCNRPVTDRHGICRHCRENAFQCRLCRNINYENLDAFLCNECGYCKHARFDYTLVSRPSFSVEPILGEEDKDKAVLTIERESENAHKCFEQIVACKKTLESLVGSAGLGSDSDGAPSDGAQSSSLPQQPPVPPSVPAGLLSRHIQTAAIVYCKDAKLAFQSMSNSVQMLTAVRQQLTLFLSRASAQPAPAPTTLQPKAKSAKRCYGCASRFVTHGLELVDRLVQRAPCKSLILDQDLLQELIRSNIHSGPPASRRQARAVVCLLIRDDMALTEQMLAMIANKIQVCLAHSRSIQVEQVLENEMLLLMDACSMPDKCWELKHRVLARELFRAVEAGGAEQTAIAQGLILPCLTILAHVCCVPSSHEGRAQAHVAYKVAQATEHRFRGVPSVTYQQWQAGTASFGTWQARTGPATREERLERKYGKRWLSKWKSQRSGLALSETWIKHLLLNPCSQAVRSVTREVMEALSSSSSFRRLTVLDLLARMMHQAAAAQDQSAELFMLVHRLLVEESGPEFLAARGFLSTLCDLISAEVQRIRAHESSSTGDIAQGYVLKQLLEVLDSLLRVPSIRKKFKKTEDLLGSMLDNFLHVQSLIVQKTKLTDDCAQLLMATFSSLSSESEEDKQRFCLACVRALQHHRQGRTPVFLLQQLVGIMCPSKAEPSYDLVLNKAPSQEEFIRGAMTKNPYASAEIGSTMRDVKRKICGDLEMQGLMDDENAMELLVNGHIVRLDLPIRLVYEQVWRPSLAERVLARGHAHPSGAGDGSGGGGSSAQMPPMVVIYRLQGLDGEATEPIVEELKEEEEEADPEVELAMTALMAESAGLSVLLERVREMDSLPARAELEPLVLGLLYDCCKLKVNRSKALELGAVDILLERIQSALEAEETLPAAETMLLIVDQLVEEASRQQQHASEAEEEARADKGEGAQREGDGRKEEGEKEGRESGARPKLERLLGKLGSPAVRSRPLMMQTLAHILPFLTHGDPALLNTLVDHFMPFLVFATDAPAPSTADRKQDDDDVPAPTAADGEGAAGGEGGAEERMAYLDCLVSVVQRMGQDATALKLRAAFKDRGVVGRLTGALASTLPLGKDKDDPAWSEAVAVDSLPRLLQLLSGMSRGFAPAQREVASAGVLGAVHVLEEMASERQTGSLAEDLLSALTVGNEELREEVEGLRQATVEKKRERAAAQREKMLAEMGLSQGGGALAMHAKALGMDELDLEDEEDGQVCVICHEGYKYKPEEVMGVYVLNKRCSVIAGVGAGSAAGGAAAAGASPGRAGPGGRWERCFVTVTNMTVVHYSCHAQAGRAERGMKVPRQEWEGASLRNQSTRCNNLLPMRSALAPSHMFSEYAERYWATLSHLGRHEGSRFRIVVHDVRLLLRRLASGLSFASDSGGGSALSNVKLLPYLIQMGYYCLGDPSTTVWRQASGGHSGTPSRSSRSASAAGGGGSPDKSHAAALADGPDYHAVASLWFPDRWREDKGGMLHSMVAAAMRGLPQGAMEGAEGGLGEAGPVLEACKSSVITFALLKRLHAVLHKGSAQEAGAGGEEGKKGVDPAAWTAEAESAQGNIIAHEMKVMGQCEELVSLFEEELAPCESLSELFDAAELLHDITPQGDTEAFLQSTLSAPAAVASSPAAARTGAA